MGVHGMRSCIGSWCAYSLAWVCLLGTQLPGQEAQDLEAVVRAGHRAARESIRTFSATVNLKQTYPKEQTFGNARYWRSLEVVRLQERAGDSYQDFLAKDNEIRQLTRIAKRQSKGFDYHAQRRPTTDRLGVCDVWQLMSLSMAGPAGRVCTLDQFFDLGKERPKASRERMDGHDCIKVSMRNDDVGGSGQEVRTTLWFDPSLNYLIRKVKASFGVEGSYDAESENLDFVEPEPGIFFPTKNRSRIFRDGKKTHETVATLADLRINAMIGSAELQLPTVPAGTVLADWIQGKKYPMNGSWQAMGPSKKLERTKISVPAGADTPEPAYHAQSSEEPKSWYQWLLVVAVVTLACAGTLWAYRRHAERRALTQ